MAKEELFRSPLIGFFARRFGGFPVGKGRLDRRAGKIALELLAKKEAIVIFPEGKRSPDGTLGSAYSGAALLTCKTGVPIVPVGITGTASLTGKAWFLHRPQIHINIGMPFHLTCRNDKLTKDTTRELSARIMRHIAGQLPKEYRGKYSRAL
jgi:1-acyl-sn-glycerol-3-phosphate acyltransferase